MRENDMEEAGEFARRTAEDYLDLRYLKYFVVTAESGSFTKAAALLNTVQPSISRQIKRLEEIVEVPLFTRTSHELILTPPGKLFLVEAKKLLRQARASIQLVREASDPMAGRINVGVASGIESLFFDHVLSVVRRIQPDSQVSIRSSNEAEMRDRLREGNIDFAFMAGPVMSDELISLPVISLPLHAAFSVNQPIADLDVVPIQDLMSLKLLLPDMDSVPFYGSSIKRIAELSGISFEENRTSCESPLSALQAIADADYFCFILECQGEFAPSSILIKPVDAPISLTIDLHLIGLKNNPKPWVQRFLEAFRARDEGSDLDSDA